MIARRVIALLVLLALPVLAEEDVEPPRTEMTPLQAVVLGVVEGITEYLPVSSTGHLILTSRAMGIGVEASEKTAADAYTICIQAGAILAVVGLYWRFIFRMLLGLVGRDREGLGMALNLGVAFAPAMVIGLLLGDLAKQYLFNMWFTVIAWFIGGVVILVLEKGKVFKSDSGLNDLYQMNWKQALTIGLMQCIAIWPGTSRSLVTIIGGRTAGLSLPAAVVFSFLLGCLTLTAATAYDGLKYGKLMIDSFGPAALAIGSATAFVSAIVAVKWMVSYLSRKPLSLFGWYRIALSLVVAGLLLSAVLPSGT